MLNNLKNILGKEFSFYPSRNQLKDMQRLTFEIMKRENVSLREILNYLKNDARINKSSGKGRFLSIKETLIKRRFPLTSTRGKIDARKVFLSKIRKPLPHIFRPDKDFTPLKIFVEKGAKNSALLENFKNKFKDIEIEELNSLSGYIKKNKFNIAELKKPLVFIVQESWDFIKPCPCTKYHLSCGYWIFNLGFGCPFDCSYCFLQQYTNFPGIILPANLEDFFDKFDAFSKRLKKPIRIGTGEFCDSLALDEITAYSKELIPYFNNKNVLFELKTKSAQIKNLLEIKPSFNIVISWSLNPEAVIKREELGTASLKERLKAAKLLQEKGYRIGIHFDPIIHFRGWQNLYKELIKELYLCLKPPFAWISLGTLRSNRHLKTVSELRFPESKIFYEELFLGEDKKLRYPLFLRKEIYKKITGHIRNYDPETPIYLCMENKREWRDVLNYHQQDIENYLIGI